MVQLLELFFWSFLFLAFNSELIWSNFSSIRCSSCWSLLFNTMQRYWISGIFLCFILFFAWNVVLLVEMSFQCFHWKNVRLLWFIESCKSGEKTAKNNAGFALNHYILPWINLIIYHWRSSTFAYTLLFDMQTYYIRIKLYLDSLCSCHLYYFPIIFTFMFSV